MGHAPLYIHDDGHQPALRHPLRNLETTLVLSEAPIGLVPGPSRRIVPPGVAERKMIKLASWNIGGRTKAWNNLLNSDADVALLQEARKPPQE